MMLVIMNIGHKVIPHLFLHLLIPRLCLCCFYNKPEIKALNRVGLHHLNFCSLFHVFRLDFCRHQSHFQICNVKLNINMVYLNMDLNTAVFLKKNSHLDTMHSNLTFSCLLFL